MALALKKDVQKASYYVFFLGAQEARELRGERVLLSTLPHIISRSRQQEPLKVTLQISQKGIKIIQGSVKHFIPHNAITCSIVSDDVVACVLLLYNPETRCPLHVHCYRCDSADTAQALNDQLQMLIKKPENQKKFAELEVKLQKTSSRPVNMPIKSTTPPNSSNMKVDIIQRRFESSLGSDAGTSRESECSAEDVQQHSPPPIDERHVQLFDSLAAELKQKLRGNGPPLLLPPRDYDTMSRSQGNLAAVEMRRCKNLSIIGSQESSASQKKSKTSSSHGSSGIGSDDLPPSPDLANENISNGSGSRSSDDWKHELANISKKLERSKIAAHFNDKKHMKYHENMMELPIKGNKKSSPSAAKYHDMEKQQQLHDDRVSGGLMRQQSERYRIAVEKINYEKEKFYKHDNFLRPSTQSYEMDMSRHMPKTNKSNFQRYPENSSSAADRYIDVNPYREVESLPYQQSNDMFCRGFHRKSTNEATRGVAELSTMKRTTPHDRFVNAKEKFQAIDRRHDHHQEFVGRRNEAYQQRDIRQSYSPKRASHGNYHEACCSSDEEYHRDHPTRSSMLPAKSMGNLARSRHSYAEPMNFFSGCNRVGLARIT